MREEGGTKITGGRREERSGGRGCGRKACVRSPSALASSAVAGGQLDVGILRLLASGTSSGVAYLTIRTEPGGVSALPSMEWTILTRVGQRGAIENGYSTRARTVQFGRGGKREARAERSED